MQAASMGRSVVCMGRQIASSMIHVGSSLHGQVSSLAWFVVV